MRIDNTAPAALPTTYLAASRSHSRHGEDQVRLSIPPVSSEKIDRLAAAVDAGTYRVPATLIAASIIRETLADYH